MLYLRSLVYFSFMSLSVVLVGLPISLIGWFVSYRSRSQMANAWGLANLYLLKLICGLDYRIEGQENIPDGNCIVLSKHQSAWETIALRGLLPPEQAWVLKRELMWVPIFGWALYLLQPVAIDRSAGRKAVKQVIDKGCALLEKGRTVIIFPEGTRVAPGTRKRYGMGGALLAEKSGYPVLPVAHNAGSFWRRRDLRKYPGTITLAYGPVIETRGLSAAEINTRVEAWIEGKVAELESDSP